jgi:hypothetical protein
MNCNVHFLLVREDFRGDFRVDLRAGFRAVVRLRGRAAVFPFLAAVRFLAVFRAAVFFLAAVFFGFLRAARSGSFAAPVSRFHSSNVSGEISPFTIISANFRRCALLLNGIDPPHIRVFLRTKAIG